MKSSSLQALPRPIAAALSDHYRPFPRQFRDQCVRSHSVDSFGPRPLTTGEVAQRRTVEPSGKIARTAPSVASTQGHELTLYFHPAPHGGINWKSPRSLLLSTLLGHLGLRRRPRHPIGHVSVGLSGTTDGGERKDIFLTGMTSQESSTHRKQVFGGYGLGVLFTEVPGRLESPEEVNASLDRGTGNGKLSFVTIKMSPEMAQRVATYVQEYERRGYDAWYGLPNKPLEGEGAGCSAFGASFLEVMGFQLPEFQEAWSKQRTVAERLVYDGTDADDQKVGLTRVLSRGKWARQGEETRDISFWDPDAMYKWTKKAHDKVADGETVLDGWSVTTATKGKAKGLVIDARALEVPEEPIFKD